MIRKLQLGFLCLLVAGCTSSGSDTYSASAQDELGQVAAALTYEIPVGQIRKSVFQSERVKFERLLCFERPGGLVLSGATALARMDAAKYRAGLDVMLDSARANLAEGGVAVSVLTPDGAETGQILIPWNPRQRTARQTECSWTSAFPSPRKVVT